MKNKNSIFIIIFLLFFSPYLMAAHIYEDQATEKAAGFVTEYITSGDKDKPDVIKKLKNLLHDSPGNINVRNMYADILIADRQYVNGLKEIEYINNHDRQPVSFLVECMLREKVGMEYQSCYNDVVALAEKEKKEDANYLTALFLANDTRFASEKVKLLKDKKITHEEALHFNLSRDKFFNEILP